MGKIVSAVISSTGVRRFGVLLLTVGVLYVLWVAIVSPQIEIGRLRQAAAEEVAADLKRTVDDLKAAVKLQSDLNARATRILDDQAAIQKHDEVRTVVIRDRIQAAAKADPVAAAGKVGPAKQAYYDAVRAEQAR